MEKELQENVEMKGAAPEQQIDPKAKQEMEAYITGLSKLIHGKDSSRQILEMLKGGEPQTTIPATALAVNEMMEGTLKQKGAPPSLDVVLAGGQFLISDLIEIGNASGIFNLTTEEQIGPILQDTMQQYIEKGLENGSIDPVELQKLAEPLMNEEQFNYGMQNAGAAGIPMEPDQNTAMQSYGAKMQKKGALQGGQDAKIKMKKAMGGA